MRYEIIRGGGVRKDTLLDLSASYSFYCTLVGSGVIAFIIFINIILIIINVRHFSFCRRRSVTESSRETESSRFVRLAEDSRSVCIVHVFFKISAMCQASLKNLRSLSLLLHYREMLKG